LPVLSPVKIKPEFNPARYSWARALDAQARTKSGAEVDRLRQLADEKVAEAVKIKAELPEALDSWGAIRRDQLNLRTDEEARKVLMEAKDVLIRAAERGEGKAAYNLACVCALLGEEDECRTWLEKARDAGKLPTREHMEQDKDLDPVRYKEWFVQFLNQIK